MWELEGFLIGWIDLIDQACPGSELCQGVVCFHLQVFFWASSGLLFPPSWRYRGQTLKASFWQPDLKESWTWSVRLTVTRLLVLTQDQDLTGGLLSRLLFLSVISKMTQNFLTLAVWTKLQFLRSSSICPPERPPSRCPRTRCPRTLTQRQTFVLCASLALVSIALPTWLHHFTYFSIIFHFQNKQFV